MILDMDISCGKGVLDVNITKDSITLLRLSLAAMVHATSFFIMRVVRLRPYVISRIAYRGCRVEDRGFVRKRRRASLRNRVEVVVSRGKTCCSEEQQS